MKFTPKTCAAELLDEPRDRLHRPTGREHVVVDHHARAAGIASAFTSSAFSPYSST